jgi:hypothetical protein
MNRFVSFAALAAILFNVPLFSAVFKVHEQVATENGKTRMVETFLSIRDGAVTVGDRTFTPETIKEVTYSRAKSPRTKSAIGIAIACLPCGIAVAFMKGKKHWLTFQDENGYAGLKLEKGNHMQIAAAVEDALDVKAERIIE